MIMPLSLVRQWQRRNHEQDTQAYHFSIEQVIPRCLQFHFLSSSFCFLCFLGKELISLHHNYTDRILHLPFELSLSF